MNNPKYVYLTPPVVAHVPCSAVSSAGVSTTSLVAISGTCGLVALIIGFVAGSRDDHSGYQPVPSV